MTVTESMMMYLKYQRDLGIDQQGNAVRVPKVVYDRLVYELGSAIEFHELKSGGKRIRCISFPGPTEYYAIISKDRWDLDGKPLNIDDGSLITPDESKKEMTQDPTVGNKLDAET